MEIEVNRIEELQTLKDADELERIFAKAKASIVSGQTVELKRRTAASKSEKFDELSTLDDLENYHKQVFKYL